MIPSFCIVFSLQECQYPRVNANPPREKRNLSSPLIRLLDDELVWFGQIFKSDFRSRIKVYINFKVNCSNVFENYSSQDETRVISIFICNFTCIRPFFLFAPLPLYFRSPPLFSFLALFLSSRQPTTHTYTHSGEERSRCTSSSFWRSFFTDRRFDKIRFVLSLFLVVGKDKRLRFRRIK